MSLQSQLISSKKHSEIISSPYLLLAAKIFLSRQIAFPYSTFFSGLFCVDGFSWSDALDFVNFYLDLIYPKTASRLRIKSKFFEELLKEYFVKSPILDEMINFHTRGSYINLKRPIEEPK